MEKQDRPEKRARRARRSYTDEFKSCAVRLILAEGKQVAEVARDLALTPSSLRTRGGPGTRQPNRWQHDRAPLSPKWLNGLRRFRADLAMAAYSKSGLCRYLEEALAATVAPVKVHGLSVGKVLEGIKIPIANGYVTLSRVVTEAAIGTIVYGGVVYGVYVLVDEE